MEQVTVTKVSFFNKIKKIFVIGILIEFQTFEHDFL
jgi:hypothetical protein